MKKRYILLCIFVALLACVIFVRFRSSSTGDSLVSLPTESRTDIANTPGQSNQKTTPTIDAANMPKGAPKLSRDLFAGGRQWRLNFADKSLSDELQQRIGYDLNLVLGHLPKFEIDILPFPLEVDGRQLDRRVRFEGEGRKWNDVLQSNEFGCLFRGANESELYVPKTVIAAYNKAIELEQQNESAYRQLDQFLSRMSELRERPIEDVRSLLVFSDDNKSAEGGTAKVDPQEFAAVWGGKRYRAPSILDVSATAGTSLEKYGSLVATTYAVSSDKLDDLPPLVYHSGQWRFLMLRPPT